MTNEEAIEELKKEIQWGKANIYPYVSKNMIEACEKAIKVLEEQSCDDTSSIKVKEINMTILPSSYEVTTINSLVKGDIYVHNNVAYLVLDKKFDYIEVWNLRTNEKELRKLPMVQTVTRVKGGTITV